MQGLEPCLSGVALAGGYAWLLRRNWLSWVLTKVPHSHSHSGVHSVMRVKLAWAGQGGGCTATQPLLLHLRLTITPKSFWLGRVCDLVNVMVAIPWKRSCRSEWRGLCWEALFFLSKKDTSSLFAVQKSCLAEIPYTWHQWTQGSKYKR